MRWEHTTRIVVEQGGGLRHRTGALNDASESLLRRMGDHGWEAVSMCQTGYSGQYLVLFKRAVSEEADY